jgi:hypothetical protein
LLAFVTTLAYALERIAKDSEKDYLTIIEILTAYVRENAPIKIQSKNNKNTPEINEECECPKLSTDIEAILTIIGRREKSVLWDFA